MFDVAPAIARVCECDDSRQGESRKALPDLRHCIAKFSETRASNVKDWDAEVAVAVAVGDTKRRTRRRLSWCTRHPRCTILISMDHPRG